MVEVVKRSHSTMCIVVRLARMNPLFGKHFVLVSKITKTKMTLSVRSQTLAREIHYPPIKQIFT